MVAEAVSQDAWTHAAAFWRPSLALEQRAGVELAELLTSPVFYGLGVPRGDHRAVLLLPGFLASDNNLVILAGWLRRIGYRPAQSGFTVNAGSLDDLLRQVERRAQAATSRGTRVTVIGHSLGGIFARIMAVRRPDLIDSIITLGSPLSSNPRTANIEVRGTHFGLIWNAAVYRRLARLLAE
jgi:pimeloyl-ACP methyl ester carboxylesterase